MEKNNKQNSWKKIFRIKFFLILFNLTIIFNWAHSQIREGAVGGGGSGLLVKSDKSSNFILWDIFKNDPNFQDNSKGDQLELSKNWSNKRAQYLNYKSLKSYQKMREKVLAWREFAPRFVNAIESIDFLEPHIYKNAILPEYSEVLPFIMTKLFIQRVDEVYVGSNETIELTKASVLNNLGNQVIYPLGFYMAQDISDEKLKSENYNVDFVQIDLFNKAGEVSQGAFFLHERLRQIQFYDGLDNESLQRIVYLVMTQKPSANLIDDTLFNRSIFYTCWPKPEGPFVLNSSILTLKEHARVIASGISGTYIPIGDYKDKNNFKCEDIKIPNLNYEEIEKSISEEKMIETVITNAIKLNVLSTNESIIPLKNYGKSNPLPVNEGERYLLEPSNCSNALKMFIDPTYFSLTRWALSCDRQELSLNGVGGLVFKKSNLENFVLEIESKLGSNSDGGSQMEIHLFEDDKQLNFLNIKLDYNWSIYPEVSIFKKLKCEAPKVHRLCTQDYENNEYTPAIVAFNPSMKSDFDKLSKNSKRLIRLTVLVSQKQVLIEFPNENPAFQIKISVPDNLLEKLNQNNWSLYQINKATTYTIKEIM